MKFSVIIPAYNAAETLSATLDSLLSQIYGNWQAVIVDDGSLDDTAVIASNYCEKDSRFSLVKQANKGLSEARNTGIFRAEYDLLSFLDADDWVAPEYLDKFKQQFEDHPDIDALVCGWQFMLDDGAAADIRFPPDIEDMFPRLSHTCPFVVHSCIIHKRVIENVGLFDSSVGFVEDWDFWQRVARTGARFKLIREVLAFYRMRRGSLSRKIFQSYHDACLMITQGYSEDKRVKQPLEKYRFGMPDKKQPEHMCWIYCWYAALCIGTGESVKGLKEPEWRNFDPEPEQLASFVFEGVYRGGCFLPEDWLDFYRQNETALEEFFDHLRSRISASAAVQKAREELYTMILKRSTPGGEQLVGEILYLPVDPCQPLKDIETNAAKLIIDLRLDQHSLGLLELPVEGGKVRASLLKNRISEKWAWPIMTGYLRARFSDITEEEIDGPKGWELFLRELWGLDWKEANFYDPLYEDNNRYEALRSEGRIKVNIENELFDVEDPGKDLQVEYLIGGTKIGELNFYHEAPLVSAQSIRSAISANGKFELCKAAVTQGLIGKKWDKIILREELRKH